MYHSCNRAHPERKHIEVRSLKRIQCDVLEADLIGVNIDRECTDVNLVVRQYDASLSSLLDKHAPSKRINVVERPMNDWMSDDILVLKLFVVNMSHFGVRLVSLFTLICIQKVVWM